MPFCSACRFQVVDNSTSVCPNCGAPLEIPETEYDSVEQVTPGQTSPNGLTDSHPQKDINEEDNLQICDPGDLLCADQPGSNESEANNPIGQTIPPPPPQADYEEESGEKPNAPQKRGIQKLSEEQVNNIRSNMLNGDSEYVSAQDASSIIHDLSKKNEGPELRRQETGPSEKPEKDAPPPPPQTPKVTSSPEPAKTEDAMPAPKTAPNRKIAYFHKNFIQLTGPIHPCSGEEMVIDERHYLLKPKKIKPQYTIGVFSILVVLLLFIIGKQFISPTLPGQGSIIGVILDQDGRPLISGAEIALPESGKKVKSDAIGFFRFDEVPTGVYVVQYTLPDGKIGSDNISVANDQITMLSLDAGDASMPVASSSSDDEYQSGTPTANSGSSRNMPPVPEEKKEEAAESSKNKKQYSALELNSNVDGARLIVNGEVFGAGNMTYKKLSPGKHKAKVTKSGYKSWSGNIRLKPGETFTLNVDLEKIQVEPQEETYSAEDFYQSGKTMLAEGNLDAAVSDLSEAINMKPSMADAYLTRAEVYKLQGKSKLVESDLIRAGEIYVSQKRNESALSAFTQALAANDRSVAAYINRGDLYRRMDQKEMALNDFKNAVKYDKNGFRSNYELGKMYFSLGKHKDADKRLRKARDADSRNPQVYHYLMLNYFARDDFGKVKKTYGDFKDNVSEDQEQAFKENPRYDAILRIVGEYDRP